MLQMKQESKTKTKKKKKNYFDKSKLIIKEHFLGGIWDTGNYFIEHLKREKRQLLTNYGDNHGKFRTISQYRKQQNLGSNPKFPIY